MSCCGGCGDIKQFFFDDLIDKYYRRLNNLEEIRSSSRWSFNTGEWRYNLNQALFDYNNENNLEPDFGTDSSVGYLFDSVGSFVPGSRIISKDSVSEDNLSNGVAIRFSIYGNIYFIFGYKDNDNYIEFNGWYFTKFSGGSHQYIDFDYGLLRHYGTFLASDDYDCYRNQAGCLTPHSQDTRFNKGLHSGMVNISYPLCQDFDINFPPDYGDIYYSLLNNLHLQASLIFNDSGIYLYDQHRLHKFKFSNPFSSNDISGKIGFGIAPETKTCTLFETDNPPEPRTVTSYDIGAFGPLTYPEIGMSPALSDTKRIFGFFPRQVKTEYSVKRQRGMRSLRSKLIPKAHAVLFSTPSKSIEEYYCDSWPHFCNKVCQGGNPEEIEVETPSDLVTLHASGSSLSSLINGVNISLQKKFPWEIDFNLCGATYTEDNGEQYPLTACQFGYCLYYGESGTAEVTQYRESVPYQVTYKGTFILRIKQDASVTLMIILKPEENSAGTDSGFGLKISGVIDPDTPESIVMYTEEDRDADTSGLEILPNEFLDGNTGYTYGSIALPVTESDKIGKYPIDCNGTFELTNPFNITIGNGTCSGVLVDYINSFGTEPVNVSM